MGANDDILADGGSGADKSTQPTNPSPATIDPAAITKAVEAGLAGVDKRFEQMGAGVVQYVQQALAGAQQRVQEGTGSRTDNDLTQQLLSDPETAITSVLNKWSEKNLAPYLSAKVQSDYEDQIDRQRTIVDGRWGPGAFDSLIKPEIESVVATTPNASARGDKRYIGSLVQLATGKHETLDKLLEHQTKWKSDQSKDNDMDSGGVLDAGRRRRSNQSTLTDEDRSYMAKVAEVTGDDIDMKKLEEVVKVMNKHGFLDSQIMPGVKNKLPVKGQRHSRGATA